MSVGLPKNYLQHRSIDRFSIVSFGIYSMYVRELLRRLQKVQILCLFLANVHGIRSIILLVKQNPFGFLLSCIILGNICKIVRNRIRRLTGLLLYFNCIVCFLCHLSLSVQLENYLDNAANVAPSPPLGLLCFSSVSSPLSSVCFWLRFALVELGSYELCYT